MEEDGFTEFESKITRFASNHKFSILTASGGLVLIFIVSLLLALICIPTAIGLAEQNLTERYDAHYPPTNGNYVSEEVMTNWNDVVTPVAKFLYGYLGNAIWIIGTVYGTIVIYFLFRWIYRSRRNRAEGEG
jgi:hypothetical protein